MKININYFIRWILKYIMMAIAISLCQSVNAQLQVVGDPKICPLCNPPQEISELRGRNFNLHEFPVMHLYEGQSSTSEYELYRPPNLMQLLHKDMIVPSYDNLMSRIGEQYVIDPESMYVRVVSQSSLNTLISTSVMTSTSKDVFTPWDLFLLDVTAGTPGKISVAWLVAGGTTELKIDGNRRGIHSEITFIQPVVVHPSSLPLFIQEIVITDDNRLSSNFFSLKEQKNGERVVPLSQSCPTIYSRAPYGGDYVRKTPHYLKRQLRESCADLLTVFTLRHNETSDEFEWVPIKQILLLVYIDSQENITEYYNGYTIFNSINKDTSKLAPGPK